MKILYKKTNFKKVGFSTMAFTAKILSWRFRHLNNVGCLLKRRPTEGGGGVTGTPGPPPPPPSYAPDVYGPQRDNVINFQKNLRLTMDKRRMKNNG